MNRFRKSQLTLIGLPLFVLFAGACSSEKAVSLDKAREQTIGTVPSSGTALESPTKVENFPALVRSTPSAEASVPSLTPNEEANLLAESALQDAMQGWRLFHNCAEVATPADTAAFLFVAPVNSKGELLKWTLSQPGHAWQLSVDDLPAKPLRETHCRPIDPQMSAKVDSSAGLVSSIYATAADDRAIQKRWEAVASVGPEKFAEHQARLVAFASQLRHALHHTVQMTTRFPATQEDLRAHGIGFINVREADPSMADVVLSWDGVQAYGISLQLSASEAYDAVLYVENIGGLGDLQPMGEKLQFRTYGKSAWLPRSGYDREVGREMQIIGAWNLVAPEGARLP